MIVLVAAILVIEGYLAYRYYSSYYLEGRAGAAGSDFTASQVTGETTMEAATEATVETTIMEAATETAADTVAARTDGVRFRLRATDQNTIGNSTYINTPLTTGNPNAILLIGRVRGALGGTGYDRELGVWYDAYREGKWAVFNQDRTPIPKGAVFDVIVPESPDVLVHRAGSGNTEANSTYVDDPLTNGNPDAVLDVTQNWNPGALGNTYNDHPVGVRYSANREQWAIYNEDQAEMPENAAFNVAVSEAP